MEEHNCKLPRFDVPILNCIIESGVCIDTRRNLTAFLMINEKHPLCMTYYRSHSSRRRQELKHLARYFPPMIHPLSMMALYWEFLILFIYFLIFCMQTVISVKNDPESRYYPRRVRFMLDIIFLLDMIKTFLTGYYDIEKSRTVMEPLLVAIRYLKQFFILDVVCLSYCAMVVVQIFMYNDGFQQNPMINLAELTIYLRILNLFRWKTALRILCLYLGVKSIFSRVIIMILTYLIIVILILAVIIEIEEYIAAMYKINLNDEPREVKSYFSAVCILFLINAGRKSFQYIVSKLVTIAFMLLGFCVQCFLYAQIMKTWKKYSSAQSRNQGLLQQFNEFMRYKGLPISLREKIFSFYTFKYQNQFYDEDHINKVVSKLLQQEILVYITKHHIEKAQFFHNLPHAILYKLVSRLKSEIYLTNDVIISAGQRGDCMYFIYFGTVAIYSPAGIEICHLEDGSHFGEVALVFNEPRIANVVAVTPCELFLLYRNDFLEVLQPYPEIKKKIYALATERLQASAGIAGIAASESETVMASVPKGSGAEEAVTTREEGGSNNVADYERLI